MCRQLNERGWGQTGKHYSGAEECNSSKGILGKIASDRKVGSCSWKVEPQVRSLSGSQTERKRSYCKQLKGETTIALVTMQIKSRRSDREDSGGRKWIKL